MASLEEHDFTYGDDKKTFYLAAGPSGGSLLIFVHGWPGIAALWKPQLETFASLGFRVVAPDMPGYGKSSARINIEDYAQENINLGMVALLEHLGRDKAVWIGHDWGCGAVWTFAAHYPEKTVAVAGLCVPYGLLELGLEELVKTVDRKLYPQAEYPFGQWSYMNFYETDFEKATSFFDSDIRAFLRVLRLKGDASSYGQVAVTADVSKHGGWFGGQAKPDPAWRKIPIEHTVFENEGAFEEVATAMEKTGFWAADAWYKNHARNRVYSLEKWKNNGYLDMPVLFIHAKYDSVCATVDNPKSCANMRKYCRNLKENLVEASHWVGEEKPAETSAAIARWLVEECGEYWPANWMSKTF
ncbi:hypothetical protein LTS10_008480 [Elasticomyces elasticus]|nr:hypothetical protein LTS10_008480 [Elasticomyces elasticus]